jgi:eukaryotic-like serine/threonine-protein kinase
MALAGWMLASAAGGPGQPPTATTRPVSEPASPASRPATQGPAMVNVNAAALIGRPVEAVRQRLARLGLRPRIAPSVTGGQAPGTVVTVQPSGHVAKGSAITVTAAVAPPGHSHHKGNHHKHGNSGGAGQGGGNGQGGD